MRILHINSYMLAGKFYRHMYASQEASGHDLTVHVPTPKNLDPTSVDLGFPAVIAPTFTELQRIFYYSKQKQIISDAWSRYRTQFFDIIHAHSLFANGNAAMELGQRTGTPYIVAVRGTDINVFFAKALHLRRKGIEILDKAAHIVFISEPARREVLKKYAPEGLQQSFLGKSSVIPNGIDEYWLNNTIDHDRVEAGRPLRLIQVGDIWKIKDPLSSARATARLVNQGIGATIRFVGKVREPKLAAQLAEMPGVTLVPYMTREELRAEYRSSDIMVMPSVQETFGLVYAEAMTQGLPIVYTRGQGFDGQFPDGEVGFPVRPHTPTDIAEGVRKICDNYARISSNSRRHSSRFSWHNITGEYDPIYREALGGS